MNTQMNRDSQSRNTNGTNNRSGSISNQTSGQSSNKQQGKDYLSQQGSSNQNPAERNQRVNRDDGNKRNQSSDGKR